MIRTADVGDEVPSFNLDSTMGRISFHDIIDSKWCLLVTFGSANEPVATTDLGMLAKLSDEFDARGIFVIAVGNDSGKLSTTQHWITTASLSSSISCRMCGCTCISTAFFKLFSNYCMVSLCSAQLSEVDQGHRGAADCAHEHGPHDRPRLRCVIIGECVCCLPRVSALYCAIHYSGC